MRTELTDETVTDDKLQSLMRRLNLTGNALEAVVVVHAQSSASVLSHREKNIRYESRLPRVLFFRKRGLRI